MNHVTKYTNSLRNYAIAVASAHVVVWGWLYPQVLITIVVPPIIFYLLFLTASSLASLHPEIEVQRSLTV